MLVLFLAAQILSVTAYLALASYVASNRSSRAAELPFIAFCLTQAIDAATYLLLNTPDLPSGVPALLRLRAAVAMLAPALYLHMAVHSVHGRHAFVGSLAAIGAYAVGGTGAVLVGVLDQFMLGAYITGVPGAYIVRPVLTSAGSAYAIFTTAINLIITLPLLVHALATGINPRHRSATRNVLTPAAFLMLSLLVRAPEISLPASLGLVAGLLQRAFSLAAGLLLANGVMRYGSPAGRPLHHRLSPVAIMMPLAILAGIPTLLQPGHTADAAALATPMLIGVFGGVLLARPETLRLTDRLLRRGPPLESRFYNQLRRAWRTLASRESSDVSPGELAQALQREISAAQVLILERTLRAEEPNHQVFTGSARRPLVRLPAGPVRWPLTEAMLHSHGMQIEGLPGPASLILPIRTEADVLGILVIGESERGGVYGRSEVMLSEMLATFLAAAHSAGVPLVERPIPPDAWPQPVPSPPGLPAIRAFGRLEVTAPFDRMSLSPTIPLRARQLLALLLVAHPEPVSAETLMTRLWPDSPPKKARNSLYVAVHALRRTLQPTIATCIPSRFLLHEGDAYRLHLDGGIWVDTREFEAAYLRGKRLARSDRAEDAVREFQRALALYRGPFLAEGNLDLSPEGEPVRQRFRNQCAEMARFVLRHLGEAGRWPEASDVVNDLRRADPWDEVFLELVGQIMHRSVPPVE